jgi:cellulose synthase/poly-beta-1,6-N-acetylglucosamine synthase-like glycosyltransferase
LCWWLGIMLRRDPRVRALGEDELPTVSIVTVAFNEAASIAATIDNKLGQDYPADRLEILVVSDASTDGTDSIVGEFSGRGVRLVRQDPRAGKTSGLNLVVSMTHGAIVAFADANSMWAPDALRHLVVPFADPEVGYATGRMTYRAPDGSLSGEGCSAYMRYENQLREWETRMGSIVGVDGGIDAVRRELYEPMRPDQLPDFVLPLAVREKGYRVVYAPKAHLHEDALESVEDEFRMRVRVALRAWHALKDKAALLNPFRFGLFAWQLASHKLLRYLAPFFQAGALVTALLLLGSGEFWHFVVAAQAVFYALALVGHLWRGRVRVPLVAFPYYLTLINIASLAAFASFLSGKKQVMWTPRT